MTRSEWVKARQTFLRKALENGFISCRHCGKSFTVSIFDGVIKSDVTVDHMQGRGRRPDLASEQSNLQALCFKCHDKKDGGFKEA